MKPARMFLLALCMLASASTVSAQGTGFGVGAGVMDGDFTAQLRKNFWLGGEISQITAQGSVCFHSRTTFRIDADYHFVIKSGKGRFYPLAGLQFAFNSDDVEFGINGGGGINFMLTEKMAAFGEVKYVFGDWDGWAIIGGIYF